MSPNTHTQRTCERLDSVRLGNPTRFWIEDLGGGCVKLQGQPPDNASEDPYDCPVVYSGSLWQLTLKSTIQTKLGRLGPPNLPLSLSLSLSESDSDSHFLILICSVSNSKYKS